MKSEAIGFSGLAAGRVNFAAMVDGRRNGLGDSYAIVTGVARLQAMAVAAALRNGDTRAGASVRLLSARRQMLDAEMGTGHPPLDWHVWVESAAYIEDGLHGGMAGVADSAFYASLRKYLAQTKPPVEARAAIDFLHGLAAWDFAEASRAADALLAAAAAGDMWLDPDMLRDGAVMAKLATGDRRVAREAFKLLIPRFSRSSTDLRTRRLDAFIADTTDARVVAIR